MIGVAMDELLVWSPLFAAQMLLLPLLVITCASKGTSEKRPPTDPLKQKDAAAEAAAAPAAPAAAAPAEKQPKTAQLIKKPQKPKSTTISQTILTTFKPDWLDAVLEPRSQGTQMGMDEVVIAETCKELSVKEAPAALPAEPEEPPPPSVEMTQDDATDETQEHSIRDTGKKLEMKPIAAPAKPKAPRKVPKLERREVKLANGKKKVIISDGLLEADPGLLNWSVKGGYQTMKLHNTSGARQAIKIKCSDNGMFRVNPVTAFIEEDGEIEVNVYRGQGNAKEDQLVILTAEAEATDKKPGPLFAKAMVFPNLVVEQTFKE